MIARFLALASLALLPMFASAQVPVLAPEIINGRHTGLCDVLNGRFGQKVPCQIGNGGLMVVQGQTLGSCSGTAWRFSLTLPGSMNGVVFPLGQIGAQGCTGSEETKRRLERRETREPREVVVERRVERTTETRLVQTMREAFCGVGIMESYNGVISCVERSGAGYLRVTEVLYRLVPARSVDVPASCETRDGKVLVGPACERQYRRDTQPERQAARTATANAQDQTCALLDRSGQVAYDFLANDSSNPLGKPVTNGAECRTAKERYANG